nr:copper chaperone PCu(A)C [Ardenticatena sp.]
MLRKWLWLLPLVLLMSGCTGTGQSEGRVEVRDAWSRPVQQMAMGQDGESEIEMGTPGVIFATIVNRGDTTDRLLRVETAVAERAEIHRTAFDANGVAKMMPQPEGVEVPASETVPFEPGGYHVMLMELQRALKVGDSFEATFVFEKAGPVTVTVEVRDQ